MSLSETEMFSTWNAGSSKNNSNPDWGLEWKANQRKVVHTHCIQSSTTVRRWKIFWPTELLGKNRKTRDLLLISSVARQKIGTAWVTTVWQIGNGQNYQKKVKLMESAGTLHSMGWVLSDSRVEYWVLSDSSSWRWFHWTFTRKSWTCGKTQVRSLM